MSFMRQIEIHCDRCGNWRPAGYGTVSQGREQLSTQYGWGLENGKDLCPDCKGTDEPLCCPWCGGDPGMTEDGLFREHCWGSCEAFPRDDPRFDDPVPVATWNSYVRAIPCKQCGAARQEAVAFCSEECANALEVKKKLGSTK